MKDDDGSFMEVEVDGEVVVVVVAVFVVLLVVLEEEEEVEENKAEKVARVTGCVFFSIVRGFFMDAEGEVDKDRVDEVDVDDEVDGIDEVDG